MAHRNSAPRLASIGFEMSMGPALLRARRAQGKHGGFPGCCQWRATTTQQYLQQYLLDADDTRTDILLTARIMSCVRVMTCASNVGVRAQFRSISRVATRAIAPTPIGSRERALTFMIENPEVASKGAHPSQCFAHPSHSGLLTTRLPDCRALLQRIRSAADH